jgi:hypothetical protein
MWTRYESKKIICSRYIQNTRWELMLPMCLEAWTVGPYVHRHAVPRRPPLRNNHECSGCIEFSTLELLKFTYSGYAVGLSIHDLKPHGVGYITVTKIAVVHINTAHQKLHLIFFFPWEDYHKFYFAFRHIFTKLRAGKHPPDHKTF